MKRPALDEEQQLPLELGHTPGRSRADLVVSAPNLEAVNFIERWPDWPAPVAVLAGPAGSGKSHLGSIWRGLADATIVGAQHAGGGLSEHDHHGPYLIEDADQQQFDETGLFHLINSVRQEHSHLLITARQFPAAWGLNLPDLISRLKAATIVEIREPDDELLAGVMTKLFADRQVEVEPHVVQFLVRRIERSLATAHKIVDRLDRIAMQRQTRITRALAGEVVTAMDEGQAELDV